MKNALPLVLMLLALLSQGCGFVMAETDPPSVEEMALADNPAFVSCALATDAHSSSVCVGVGVGAGPSAQIAPVPYACSGIPSGNDLSDAHCRQPFSAPGVVVPGTICCVQ